MRHDFQTSLLRAAHMTVIRLSSVIIISILLSGCVLPERSVTLNLEPAWIPVLFSKRSEASAYIASPQRHWLYAAAYFVDKEKQPFPSTEALNSLLEGEFGPGAKLDAPFPKRDAQGVFLVELVRGGVLSVQPTDVELKLSTNNDEFRRVLLREIYGNMGSRSGGATTRPLERSRSQAFIQAFQNSRFWTGK